MNKGDCFVAGNCSENVCVVLVNFPDKCKLWISLCITGYKDGFCCGIQQTVIFVENTCCGVLRTPYNAPPLTGSSDALIAKPVAQPERSNPVKTPRLAREKG